MLEYKDTPYEYFPPAPNRFLIWAFQQYNRLTYLSGSELRIADVQMSTDDAWAAVAQQPEARLLFVPNHCTHADPQLIFEAQRRLGRPSLFMAAYDVFQRDAFRAWIMQKSGAFSVDREGSDKLAIKAAIKTLVDGRYALTVFAEGNVYLQNDRVTPFLDGASYFGLKAQKDLGADVPVYIVPVSIKVSHLTDVRETLAEKLTELAALAETTVDHHVPVSVEIERIGVELLRRKLTSRGHHDVFDPKEPLAAYLGRVAEQTISTTEGEMEISPRATDTLLERFQKMRRQIHQIRLDMNKADQHERAAKWADDAILAFRVLSYSGDYLGEAPSLDRVGETIEKLMEDQYTRIISPFGDRRGMMHINAPIDLRDWMERYAGKARTAMQDLTAELERSVQAGVDHLNADNSAPGAEPYTRP